MSGLGLIRSPRRPRRIPQELRSAIWAAVEQATIAEKNLNNAAPEYVGVAILELTAARERLDVLVKEARGGAA